MSDIMYYKKPKFYETNLGKALLTQLKPSISYIGYRTGNPVLGCFITAMLSYNFIQGVITGNNDSMRDQPVGHLVVRNEGVKNIRQCSFFYAICLMAREISLLLAQDGPVTPYMTIGCLSNIMTFKSLVVAYNPEKIFNKPKVFLEKDQIDELILFDKMYLKFLVGSLFVGLINLLTIVAVEVFKSMYDNNGYTRPAQNC